MTAQRLSDTLDRFAKRLRPYIPFTVLNTTWRSLDKHGQSILDIGCGRGEPMQFINRKGQFLTVGADIFKPYLRECQRQGIHDSYVLCDIRSLPFRNKSFDIVLCMQVLEHLEKEVGRKLIEAMEKIARQQVIISTPLGRSEQHPYDGNLYQEHRRIWSPAELRMLGYKVRGYGLPRIGYEGGLASRLPKTLRQLTNILWVLAGPLVYFAPQLAGAMVCIKRLKGFR